MTFLEFKNEVDRIAGYLKTKARAFNNDGNYVAILNECDAFDRLRVTGRVSSRSVTFHYGAGHTRTYEVAR